MNDFRTKIESLQQQHLLKYWDQLNSGQQEHLLSQINSLDANIIQNMRQSLKTHQEPPPIKIAPFLEYSQSGNLGDKSAGQRLIAEGKVGCLIVAGGQGTRLRFEGPKGMFPITAVKNKSLFQLFAEKTLTAGKRAGKPLPIAIMTSPLNHESTKGFFESNGYFGLNRNMVSFFSQSMLPLLDKEGNLFLEEPDSIAQGPDGNGSSLKHFVEAGIWDQWNRQGIRFLNFVLIDNPLADPFDPELLGFHQRMCNEITLKCAFRKDAKEKVGLVVKAEGRVSVIEYTELPEKERTALDNKGTLLHKCANLSLFCCDMGFVRDKAVARYDKMPMHLAFKSAKYIDDEGDIVVAREPIAWKFEKFIFDILPFADMPAALVYPRESCFAPLKNFSGDDSPETVQAALQKLDKSTIANITGIEPPDRKFELAQDFYYPTPELLQKWKDKPLPDVDYIEA